MRDLLHLRPTPAHWFEVFVPRDQTVYALEALATTGDVQLESDPRGHALRIQKVQVSLKSFERLRQRYQNELGSICADAPHLKGALEKSSGEALERLRCWLGRRLRTRRRQQRLERERRQLELLQECLHALECAPHLLERFANRTEFLFKGVFACPLGPSVEDDSKAAVDRRIRGERHEFVIVAAEPDARFDIEATYGACARLEIPSWLNQDRERPCVLVERHLRVLDEEQAKIEQELQVQAEDAPMRAALAHLSRLAWLVEQAPELTGERRICHVTGWTTCERPEDLLDILERAGIHAAARFSPPPIGRESPLRTFHPRFTIPFELFSGLLTPPSRSEIDPAFLLPFLVPLLFGFMFPDVGHGVLLVLAGLVLRQRSPRLSFLVPCGLSAIFFGVLFGDVFGRHDLIPPLWFKHMAEPLRVLEAALVFGAALLLLGILFSGVEAWWDRKFRDWAVVDGAVLILYGGALVGLFWAPAWLALPAGLIWYFAGTAIFSCKGHCAKNLLEGFGRLAEGALGLVLNTLSFLRVGAFALAHAGLSLAINTIADGVETPVLYAAVLLLGHLFATALEALLVFIQTTRLILFEFCIRFLHEEGRVFRPIRRRP